MSFINILFILFVSSVYGDVSEPKFQVLTPNELMIEVPPCDNSKLVTFRIGVRRENVQNEDLELGENDFSNSRIFIYDQRLNLRKGDTVNYLLAFKDREEGYRALTGKYVFDGVYYKKPYTRPHRFRRHLIATTGRYEFNSDEDTEGFNPVEPRFGFHPHHHHPHHGGGGRGNWPNHGPPNGFNPFEPPRAYPPFYPPNHPPPPYGTPFGGGNGGAGGVDCNDHRHDMCHNRPDSERAQNNNNNNNNNNNDLEYHCRICGEKRGEVTTPTTTPTTTTTAEGFPEIDIRAANRK